jgi:hypothetical protein
MLYHLLLLVFVVAATLTLVIVGTIMEALDK